jgi:tRNA A-37 threonylcarbamoyl transferase component Bud32
MADDLVVGGQLGNYLIESVIGRGGMSVVYRAKHSRLGTSVALKVLAPELSSDDTFRERFLREAQMAAGIDHPNVIPIHDLGVHEHSLFIVMRYVSGGDLKALLATSGPLEPQEALSLLRPVALALDAAHAHALVHRDVKPGNILVQRSSEGDIEHVYLTDFGIAKNFAGQEGLTRAGGVLGTVEYMAPEQTQGGEVNPATDVYALACVFYQCITGRTPYERELLAGSWPSSESELMPVSRLRPTLPPALDAVIAKALSTNPADRHATCGAFLNACSEALAAGAAHGAGATFADAGEAAGATVALEEQPPPPKMSRPEPEPAPAGGGSWPPTGEMSASPPAATPPPAARDGGQRGRSKRWVYAGGALAAAIAVVLAVVLGKSSSSSKGGTPSKATLARVPTNRETGSGSATVRLKGNVATVTLTTNGLAHNDALAHALHIHTGGKGVCPPESAASKHNGHLSITTTDGIKYYGPPAVSLTTRGDTSPSSILVFARYPSGGKIRYTRTITLPADVAARIRENNAVVIVHGVDYDHSGIYSGVLERSDLNRAVPATATAPGLCGSLVQSKTTASLGPRSRRRGLAYTASLRVEQAVLFTCEAPSRRATGSRTATHNA